MLCALPATLVKSPHPQSRSANAHPVTSHPQRIPPFHTHARPPTQLPTRIQPWEYGDDKLTAVQNLFQSALNAEDVRDEERLWSEIITSISPSDAPWRDDTLARVFGNRGNARGRMGKLQEALQDYERAQQLAPYAVDPVLNHGVVLEQMGRFEESIADCAHPDTGPDTATRASALLRECILLHPFEQPLRPVPLLHRVTARPLTDAPSCTFLFFALFSFFPHSDKEVLRVSPDDPAAHNNLGNSLMGLQRYPEAAASYSRAVELSPQFSFAACNRAIALFAGGKRAEAERSWRTLLRRYPDFTDARAALAAALWADGLQGQAETEWQRVDDPRYKDRVWLQKDRRWPQPLVDAMVAFLDIRDAASA